MFALAWVGNVERLIVLLHGLVVRFVGFTVIRGHRNGAT